MAESAKELVLVTGGSGFIGVHCVLKCLEAKYRVRTTIRSKDKEQKVRGMLSNANSPNINLDDLSFVEADLTKDNGWSEAVKGCTYVLHVASPFPAALPKNEDDLIIPARDGTLRVLRESSKAGVKRVVITSSFAAVGYGAKNNNRDRSNPFTEKDWTDPNDTGIGSYDKSKILAEKVAWDFIEKQDSNSSLDIAVILPGAVQGPFLGTDFAMSRETVRRLMNGELPGCPNFEFAVVDVRDVAELHVLAMTSPKAKNERFLAVAPPPMSVLEISLALRNHFGRAARRAPTRRIPNFVLKFMALLDPAVAQVVPWLGQPKPVSNEKAKTLLDWKPRTGVEAAIALAQSLIDLGLVKA